MMKMKLDYNNPKYCVIVFLIWTMMCEMSKKLAVIPPSNPTLVDNYLVDWDGMRIVRLSFDMVENCKVTMSDNEIKSLLNMELQYVILPEQDIIAKYNFDDSNYLNMYELYVHEVKIINNLMFVDVLYVDSPVAYMAVRSSENAMLTEII